MAPSLHRNYLLVQSETENKINRNLEAQHHRAFQGRKQWLDIQCQDYHKLYQGEGQVGAKPTTFVSHPPEVDQIENRSSKFKLPSSFVFVHAKIPIVKHDYS